MNTLVDTAKKAIFRDGHILIENPLARVPL